MTARFWRLWLPLTVAMGVIWGGMVAPAVVTPAQAVAVSPPGWHGQASFVHSSGTDTSGLSASARFVLADDGSGAYTGVRTLQVSSATFTVDWSYSSGIEGMPFCSLHTELATYGGGWDDVVSVGGSGGTRDFRVSGGGDNVTGFSTGGMLFRGEQVLMVKHEIMSPYAPACILQSETRDYFAGAFSMISGDDTDPDPCRHVSTFNSAGSTSRFWMTYTPYPGEEIPGCVVADDTDRDGVANTDDNCPTVANSTQADRDGAGAGDACQDGDGDGLTDEQELAIGTNPDLADTDGDGIPDGLEAPGGRPVDSDGDGVIDALDPDSDGDGLPDSADPTPTTPPPPPPPPTPPADGGQGGGGGGDDPCAQPETNPVFCYAPLVKLHPKEITFPLDITTFVKHSRLMWNRDHGCEDEVVAKKIKLGRLGRGATDPYTAQEAGWPSCRGSGRQYRSYELTKPGADKTGSLDKEEGFYLDLDDAWRLGARPVNGEVRTGAYYSISADNRQITYWFMYGFNQGAPVTGTLLDHHEGEWERVTVVLNADGTASAVRYWQHECRAPQDVAFGTATTGVTKVGTHPVVYSALGAHASYPDERVVVRGLCSKSGTSSGAHVQGIGDRTKSGGPVWRTWATSLQDAANQGWYGFGGAWGEVGGREKSGDSCTSAKAILSGRAPCLVDVTGPLGPNHKNLFEFP